MPRPEPEIYDDGIQNRTAGTVTLPVALYNAMAKAYYAQILAREMPTAGVQIPLPSDTMESAVTPPHSPRTITEADLIRLGIRESGGRLVPRGVDAVRMQAATAVAKDEPSPLT